MGVGHNVTPDIETLVRSVEAPEVLFSPIMSEPQPTDVSPTRLVGWTAATVALTGADLPLPPGAQVISRQLQRWALVCWSAVPTCDWEGCGAAELRRTVQSLDGPSCG